MFSPIVNTMSLSLASTVMSVSTYCFVRSSSTFAGLVARIVLRIFLTNSRNVSFFATKSVSALTSIIAADFLSSATIISTTPSAAILLAFFAATARPFSRRSLIASSTSPLASVSAFLHSIMPQPVFCLKSFTILAVIAAIFVSSEIL